MADMNSKNLNKIMVKVLDFLGQMTLSEPCSAMHQKLRVQCVRGADMETLNQCTSELGELLELVATETKLDALAIEDMADSEDGALTPRPVTVQDTGRLDTWLRPPGSTGIERDLETQTPLVLFNRLGMNRDDGSTYRAHRGRRTAQDEVVFHEPPAMSSAQENSLIHMNLLLIYNPNVNGLEEVSDLPTTAGTVIAGRYTSLTLAPWLGTFSW